MKIALLNRSAALDDAMAKIAAALNVFMTRDLCPAWERAPVEVTWMPGVSVAPVGYFALVAMDSPDAPGLLGYHAADPRGVPYGRAFLDVIPGRQVLHDATGRGASLAGVLAHEAAELALDAFANFWADTATESSATYAFDEMALEVADPVQESAYSITLDDGTVVDVSDFVLPAYFDPDATAGPFDHLGVLTKPLSLAAGGYAIVRSGGHEKQVTARLAHAAAPALWRDMMKAGTHSRSFRRLGR